MSSSSPQEHPPGKSAPAPYSETSPNSSSPSNTRLTPDSGSDSEDGLAFELDELGENQKLERHQQDAAKNTESDDEIGAEVDEFHNRRRRRTGSSAEKRYQMYTTEEERAVVRKFDRKLVVFVALLYMLSFLDRSSKNSTLLVAILTACYILPRCEEIANRIPKT